MSDINKDFASRLQAIIDTAIDGILTIDNKGIVETMNPSAAKIFGYQAVEVIGNNIKMLMPNPYKAEHDGYIDKYLTTKKPKIIGIGREVLGLKKDGSTFPFRLAVSEVVLNDRIIFTGIIHDLTQVKKAEEEILALNKKLEKKVTDRTYELEKTINKLLETNRKLNVEISQRQKVEIELQNNEEKLKIALEQEKEMGELKSRFVSMASHEFRTPLTSILSSAALIGRYHNSDDQDKREKHINRIKSSVANLTGILNDFLSLSKLEEGKVVLNLSEINLPDLCKEILEDTKSLLKPNQEVKYDTIGQELLIFTDETILKNILFNLISNAIKYSQKDIHCSITFHEDSFEIKIKDEGIGIPYEDQKYLFTRFFRAGNVTNIQGTGLGLNIVHSYIQKLKGTINFESIPEKGSTFVVNIPYKQTN